MEESLEPQKSQFLLPSKGYCFLCFKLVKLKSTCGGEDGLHSLERLHQYLHINFGQMINGLVSLTPGALPLMERTDVKVELCLNCADVVHSFSKLHEQLESIQSSVDTLINTISIKILSKNLTRNEREKLQLQMGHLHSNIFVKLRDETLKECKSTIQQKTLQLFAHPPSPEIIQVSSLASPTAPIFHHPVTPGKSHHCTKCNLEFSSGQALHNHHKSKHMGIRHKCNVCFLSFTQSSSLHRHFRRCHPQQDDSAVKCHICHKKFGGASYLKMHLARVHSHSKSKRVQCPCGKSYNHVSNLRLHQRRWCTLNTKKVSRKVVRQNPQPRTLLTQLEINESLQSTAAAAAAAGNQQILVIITDEGHGTAKLQDLGQAATILNYEDATGSNMNMNTLTLNAMESITAATSEETSSSSRNKKKSKNKRRSGGGGGTTSEEEDGISFIRQNSSVIGPRGGGNYPCPVCNERLGTKQALDIHQNAKHLGIRYKCDVCNSQYTQRSSLKRHFNKAHPNHEYLIEDHVSKVEQVATEEDGEAIVEEMDTTGLEEEIGEEDHHEIVEEMEADHEDHEGLEEALEEVDEVNHHHHHHHRHHIIGEVIQTDDGGGGTVTAVVIEDGETGEVIHEGEVVEVVTTTGELESSFTF